LRSTAAHDSTRRYVDALTAVQIVLIALVSRSAFVFFDAANFGPLIQLVSGRGLPTANSVIYGSSSVIDVAGPIAAGALLALQSPVLLVAYDAATFIVSAGLLLSIGRNAESQHTAVAANANLSFGTLVKDGMTFLWNKRTVRDMTLINALLCFSAGGFYAEVVVWADRSLHISRGDVRLGVLYGAFGVGAVAGSIASATLRSWLDAPMGRAALFLIAGVFGVAAFLSPNWIAAACGISVWALCYVAIMINTITVRQLATPTELQGRVNIVGRSISLGIGWPLGAVFAGLVATYSSARSSVIWCMVPLCVVGLYGLRHVRKLLPAAG
jgi:Transmembrane secretion effector